MSQAKVEQNKYKKHNRKKIERQRKIKAAVKCIVTALICGALVGVPLGINYYRSIPKFVGDGTLQAFITSYSKGNHPTEIPTFSETTEDASEDTATEKATEETTAEATSEEAAAEE